MIDEALFVAKAGDGGNGIVSFRREKGNRRGGPDGGDGGDGGSVFLLSDPNMTTLRSFAGKKQIAAQNGQPGGRKKKHGKTGEDTTVKVPVGTMIYNAETNELLFDLNKPYKLFCLVRGGKGGHGNKHFATATSRAPTKAEPGSQGGRKLIQLKLKTLAQVGFAGLPNAGKSTLLSVLTGAKPKIAHYPFTTLSPNLGIMTEKKQDTPLVVADIPGLIKGASEGKGLGIRFLKHIERCRLLVYVLFPDDKTLASSPKALIQSLTGQKKIIEDELMSFNPDLPGRNHIVLVHKSDLIPPGRRKEILNAFRTEKNSVLFASSLTREGIDELKKNISESFKAIIRSGGDTPGA